MPSASSFARSRFHRHGNSNVAVIIIVIVAVLLVVTLICGGLAVALFVPAFTSARTAAQTAVSSNNLKQIGLALHNYHQVEGSFPPVYVTDENGKPLYSWRVLILPYVEEQFLYNEFALDEPWDSSHNLPLADMMPFTYANPHVKDTGFSNETSYQAISGFGTIFEGTQAVKLSRVTDGTSNTGMIVSNLEKPVIWTAPQDTSLADFTSGRLFDVAPDGVLQVLYADGSVQRLNATDTPPKKLTGIAVMNDAAN